MGKKLTIENDTVQVSVDAQTYLEESSEQYMKGHTTGVEHGKVLAFEQMKRILSSARLTQDVKSMVWYLIDELQKDK